MNINIVEKNNSRETKFTEILKQKKQTILYFYPKDNTSGCSLEAKDFSTHLKTFLNNEIQVV
jgi:peroxiredoxin Q/BCP